MKVKFFLRSPKSNSSSITLIYYNKIFKSRAFKYGTGIKVTSTLWNQDKQRVNLTGAPIDIHGEIKKINQKLETIKAKLLNFVEDNDQVTSEALKAHLDSKTGVAFRKKQARINRQPEVIKWFLDHVELNREQLKSNTVTSKKQTINVLKDYASESHTKLSFDSFDHKHYDKFKLWMATKFSINTIWKHTKEIKSLFRAAEKYKIIVHPDYRLGFFKAKQVATEQICLSDKQIEKIRKVDLSELPSGYDRARDLFIIGALSGLRYSDFSTLTKEHFVKINKQDFIRKEQVKTGHVVVTPIGKTLKKLFKKYNGSAPAPLAQPLMNRYLKDIAEEAKIKEFDQVTTHTARRSFASNAYLAGVPTLSIMQITGHKTEKSFLRYIIISPEEHSMKLTQVHKRFLQ